MIVLAFFFCIAAVDITLIQFMHRAMGKLRLEREVTRGLLERQKAPVPGVEYELRGILTSDRLENQKLKEPVGEEPGITKPVMLAEKDDDVGAR